MAEPNLISLLKRAAVQFAKCAAGHHDRIFQSAVCGHMDVCLACRDHPFGEDCPS